MEGKEVLPIKMTKSEFLDATHISDYALNVYEASDADTGYLFLLCHERITWIWEQQFFCVILTFQVIAW